MEEVEIKTVDLSKEYQMGKEKVHALNGVNISITKGSFVSVTGTSGSGKTTLLHLIGALDKPTSGKVYISNEDITSIGEKRLAEIRRDYVGFVFQKFCLVQELTVRENIAFPALLKSSNIDKEYMDFLIARLGIDDRLGHMPSELSGGQQQRVAIARALINKPKVILCDEPTGNLDSKTSQDVMELLIQLHKELKTTLVIVTHDLEIADMAEKKILIEDGKIVL